MFFLLLWSPAYVQEVGSAGLSDITKFNPPLAWKEPIDIASTGNSAMGVSMTSRGTGNLATGPPIRFAK